MPVVCCQDISLSSLKNLLQRFSLQLSYVDADAAIPGSWFGEPEAGLIGNTLYVRPDTPLHSALHEACHYICMPAAQRAALHTNAGGDFDEENAVCFLSILLSDYLDSFDRDRMMQDMDTWSYTFRLGSSKVWFEKDAEDAENWLRKHRLINNKNIPYWTIRE